MEREHHVDRIARIVIAVLNDLLPGVHPEAHSAFEARHPHLPNGLVRARIVLKYRAVFELWRNQRLRDVIVVPHDEVKRLLECLLGLKVRGPMRTPNMRQPLARFDQLRAYDNTGTESVELRQ